MTSPDSGPTGLRKAADADRHPSTPLTGAEDSGLLRRGASTADSVGGPDRDKLVPLEVQVPKSLRKAVKAEAKRRGIPLDALVAEALRERTAR
jgi:hypothetical protein